MTAKLSYAQGNLIRDLKKAGAEAFIRYDTLLWSSHIYAHEGAEQRHCWATRPTIDALVKKKVLTQSVSRVPGAGLHFTLTFRLVKESGK